MDTNQYGDYFRCEFDTLGDTVSFSIVSLSNVDEIKEAALTWRKVYPKILAKKCITCD